MDIVCPHCKKPNPPDSKFCDNCGYQLVAAPPPAAPPPAAPPPAAPPPAGPLYSLTFKTGALDVEEPTKSFGRKDFGKYFEESDYKYISRAQFTIVKEQDKFFIQDGGEREGKWHNSANGTKLNGTKLEGAEKKELNDMDKILIADTIELQFMIHKQPK